MLIMVCRQLVVGQYDIYRDKEKDEREDSRMMEILLLNFNRYNMKFDGTITLKILLVKNMTMSRNKSI